MQKIRIISRNSKLAMWQAEYVKDQLKAHYFGLEVEIIGITTEGDRILDKSLDKIGGKGLFIKELEYQLLVGNADIAVHSLKDLPANLPCEFELAAILPRENPYDAFVSNKYTRLAGMPAGAIIGTSSARRVAILKKYHPTLDIKLLRGNLQTRLAKLDNNEYDAIILAVAGLKRLGLENRISEVLPKDKFIPAIGQGALAVEICSNRDDLKHFLTVIHDEITAQQIGAEREMGRFMNASCNLPIAGFAEVDEGKLKLTAFIADNENNNYIYAESLGDQGDFLQVGQECAKKLLIQGADNIVARHSKS